MKRLFLLKFPKEEDGFSAEGGPALGWKEEIQLTEKFFEILGELKQSVVLEAAVSHVGEEISFYLAAENRAVDLIRHQLQKIWPTIQITEANDYDVFNPQGFNEGAYLELTQNFSLSLPTYEQAEIDIFASVLAVLARLEEIGEGVSIQLLIQPSSKDIKKKIAKSLKAKKILFKTNLRLIVSAASQFRAKEIFENLSTSFSQFSGFQENELKIIKPKDIKNFHFKFCFREFDEEQTMILNSEELASVFHFPVNYLPTPRIKWLKSKEAPPPTDIPDRGVIIGENTFQGRVQPVYLNYPDRAYNLEIIGQAGTGKSTSLINLALQDIEQGKGIAIIDPEGDIVQGVAGALPRERLADVIYLDPTNLWYPFGLNLLEVDSDNIEEKTFIIEEALSIFQKLFIKEITHPLLEKYLKNCLRLLLDKHQEPATLIDIPRVFTDQTFRQKKLQQITDVDLIEFWKNEVTLHEITPFITARFNTLIANDYLRPIIGQTRSAFNFRKAIDGGKIILINLAKNQLGEFNAGLLGMIFMGKISLAAFSRINQPFEKRRPFYLFVDEFHNYFTDSLAISLATASRYGLYLNVVHRSTDELSPALFNLINNFGSIMVFRVGLDDASALVDKFKPVFSVNDLINLDNFNAYSRILINEKLSNPFNIRISAPPFSNSDLIKEVKELSRNIYNRYRQKVEMEIYERFSNR